jgi:hypothetical protein
MDDLPTIKQILQKADALGDRPMDDDTAQEWFEQTKRMNREHHYADEAASRVREGWR